MEYPLDTVATSAYVMGTLFEALRTSREATWSAITAGDFSGVVMRRDIHILRDFRAGYSRTLEAIHNGAVTADDVVAINAALTESASLHPGAFRDRQSIGVTLPDGTRHEPPLCGPDDIQAVLDEAARVTPVERAASVIFAKLSKMQPFFDGNKRTAAMAASGVLSIGSGHPRAFHFPYDEYHPEVARNAIGLMADYYTNDQYEAAFVDMLTRWQSHSDSPTGIG